MRDLVRRNAEPFRDDLRKHRSVSLAGVLYAQAEQNRAVSRKGQHRALERRSAGMFKQAADAEAAIFAALLRFAAALLEPVIVGERKRLVEDRLEIAAVVGGADCCLVWHGRLFDQIAPPQLDRVDAGDARRLVDDAL